MMRVLEIRTSEVHFSPQNRFFSSKPSPTVLHHPILEKISSMLAAETQAFC